MASIFVFAENVQTGHELISLIIQSGRSASAIAINEAAAESLAAYGAEQVYLLKGAGTRVESYAPAMAELLKEQDADALLVGSTVRGRDLAAQIAALRSCGLVSDATALTFISGGVQTERLMYGGAVVQTEQLNGFGVITIAAGKFPPAEQQLPAGSVIIREVECDSRVSLVSSQPIIRQGVDLANAKTVVCAGLGFDKQEDLKIAEELGAALGAALGCTRPLAEDKGWMPAETYIGISGAMIKPDLYVGLGVSGQVQHTVGIRDSKIVVAINNNDKAPIFQIADYGIAGDIYEIIPLLTEAVRKVRG